MVKGIREPVYDYDNYSLYSQVSNAYRTIHDNIHLSLKPNTNVIYDI